MPTLANVSPPTISGSPTAGVTLTEQHGAWSRQPTGYSYLWLRCDPDGNYCTPTADATDTYTLTAAEDVGFAIRVEEVASDGSGPSLPATSAATVAVGPAPAGGAGSSGGSTPGAAPGAGSSPGLGSDSGSGLTPSAPGPTTRRASVADPRASGTDAVVVVSCVGPSPGSCAVKLSLSEVETVRDGKTIALAAAAKPGPIHRRRIALGTRTVTVRAGHRETVRLALNRAGRRLLARHGRLRVGLTATQVGRSAYERIIVFKPVTRR